MARMTSREFCDKLRAAVSCKTLYVMGCFGAPMTAANKKRYLEAQPYNRRVDRKKKIEAASADTFGFDCVCLIKGILWGWNQNTAANYGGATYASNGVPDIGTEEILERCGEVSTRFDTIKEGELVWMPGHVGIYVGGGLVVECTPIWKDAVQFSACNRSVDGYPRRDWIKHGKLPYVDYTGVAPDAPIPPAAAKPTASVKEWQTAAQKDGFSFPKYGIDGEWGAECAGVAQNLLVQQWSDGKYRYPNATRLAQRLLGMPASEQDGLCGPKTTAAIKVFQKAKGLTVDGGIGVETWPKLLGV